MVDDPSWWSSAGPWREVGVAVLGWGLFGLAILVALLLNLLGLFGNWIILGAVGLAWLFTGHFSVVGLLVMLGFAVLGEVLEAALAGWGASRFGGSRGGIVAALVGAIAGAVFGSALIPIPVLGTLIAACLGAFAFAAGYEYIQHQRTVGEAAWTGLGAAVGKIGGVVAKFACGLVMLAIAWWTYGPATPPPPV